MKHQYCSLIQHIMLYVLDGNILLVHLGRGKRQAAIPRKSCLIFSYWSGGRSRKLATQVWDKNFCPFANSAPKADWGWEAARPCASKEAKPAKIVSLIVPPRRDCARPLKEKEIFAGFTCPAVSGASRWAGLFKIRLRILFKESSNLVQKAPLD